MTVGPNQPDDGPTRGVGFWRDPDDHTTEGLPDPHAWVDESWDRKERAMVVRYLRRGHEHMVYPGETWCRFRCGIDDADMGTRDLTDGTWVWPEGFAHYVDVHAVRPPAEFVEHVRRRVAEGKVGEGFLRRLARVLGVTGGPS
jgi:hypothetical protein